MKSNLLTTQEAASYLQVSASLLARWRREGRGPRYARVTFGKRGRVRYTKSDLDGFLRSRVRRSK